MNKLNIYLNGGEKIWFTSDQHFGHANIIKFCNRPFDSVEEMNQAIIDNWNSCVGENDMVFTLGDFAWLADAKKIADLISKLNGKIYMVMGNHDSEDTFKTIKCDRLTILSDVTHLYIRLKNDKRPIEIHLSHYPLMTWSGRHRKSYNFHGHVHSKLEGDSGFDANLPYWKGHQIDVGVDRFDYKPIDLQSLLYILEDNKAVEGLRLQGKENLITKMNIVEDGEKVSVEFKTYLGKQDKEIVSLYEWLPTHLHAYQERYAYYPLHPITEMVNDHRERIIEGGGPWLDNILPTDQYTELQQILNKYKKEP